MNLTRHRLFDWGVAVIALAAGVRIAATLPLRMGSNDFAHYYLGSRLVWEGRNPYTTPLEPLYAARGWSYEPAVNVPTNPPPLQWLLAPWAALPAMVAFWLWVVVQATSLALVLWLCRQLLGARLSARAWWWLSAGVIASTPVYMHFYFSQVQLPLCALVLAAYRWQAQGKHLPACLAIALAGALKLFPLVWLPWFIWQADTRRQRAVLAASAAALLMLCGGVPFWRDFAVYALPVVRECVTGNPVLNLPAFILNLGAATHGFVATSTALRPWWVAGNAVAAGWIAAGYVFASRTADRELRWCVVLVAGLTALWSTQHNYFVFLAYPVAVLATRPAARPGLAAAVLLLNCPSNITSPWFDQHLVAKVLVNYLPLYGLLLLNALFVRELRRPR